MYASAIAVARLHVWIWARVKSKIQDDIGPDINLYFITFNSNLVLKHFLHILDEYKIRISLLQSNWL